MIQTTVADQIIQVINDLCQKFGIAIDWSAENLVPVAERLGSRIVEWNTAEAIFWIVLLSILITAGIIIAVQAYKKWPESYGGYEAITVVSLFVVFIAGIGCVVNIYDLIKCLTFPELKILEYIQSFMQ